MRKTIDQKILLDKHFTKLDILGQHLWMTLQLHPKTNALGVCDWTFEKINAYTRGNTPALFRQAGRELVNEGLLVVDENTEEALLLDHIDLTADSGTIESAYLGTASPRLRRILVSELNRTLRQGKHFPFEWEEIHDILSEPNADSDEYEEPHSNTETVEDDSQNTSQTDNSTSKKEKEPVQQDDIETSSVEPVEAEDKPVGKRRGRPRKNPLPPEGEDKPKRRRGRPRKYKPEPAELMDGTMEPPFEEPMTMEQVEVLPQYDSDAPIDVDDDGEPKYLSWDEIPQQLWFWHPLPEDWSPTEKASKLYKDLGGGSKMTILQAADLFRKVYDSRLYVERDNGFKAAPLSPDRLFIQQLLHWRKEKDEENERKAKEKAEKEAFLNEEPTIDVDPIWGNPEDLVSAKVEQENPQQEEVTPLIPDEEVPKVRHYKRMVPKDWKPNQKHIDRANELNIDVNTEAEKFYNYSHSNGKKYLDFDRAFDNWLLNADKFNRNGQSRRKTRSEEGYEHNMNMLKESIAKAGWDE